MSADHPDEHPLPGAESPRQIGMHWFSLAFSEEGLKEAFLSRYARRFLPQARVSLLLGRMLYASFGVLE